MDMDTIQSQTMTRTPDTRHAHQTRIPGMDKENRNGNRAWKRTSGMDTDTDTMDMDNGHGYGLGLDMDIGHRHDTGR
jgi:hypothetical protein